MLENIARISLLNKIFNVRQHEWSRICLAWLIRLMYRFGFVVGWTVLVALFVSNFGITSLPYLFILTALFTLIGSLFFTALLGRFSREKLIFVNIFASIFIILAAIHFRDYSEILSFSLLIVVVAIFLMQLKIMITGYVEEMFTPLESERTFPLIEASETIGGILAGLAVMFTSNYFEVFTYFYFWVFSLLAIIPLIFLDKFLHEPLKIGSKKASSHPSIKVLSACDKLKQKLTLRSHYQYFIGLTVIVFLQWFLFNLIEFQYLLAVYENVNSVVFDAGSGFEHAFIHDLGAMFILFSSSALLVQLIVGSRLIESLGVIGTMSMHAVVTFFSMLGVTFSFGFNTAVLAKNNFTMTTVLHTNAYHSSYYVFDDAHRSKVREILEGAVRPIAAILGTSALILLQSLFEGENLVLCINLLVLFAVLVLFYVTYVQQSYYTTCALRDLQDDNLDLHTRVNALDILTQKGHSRSFVLPYLIQLLDDKKQPVALRLKLIKSLGQFADHQSVSKIVSYFESKDLAVVEAAIDSLFHFADSASNKSQEFFTSYKIVNELKALFHQHKNSVLRLKIISLMTKISSVTTLEFLLDILRTPRSKYKAEAIIALKSYSAPEIVDYLKPYLNSRSSKEKMYAAINLAKFVDLRDKCLHIVDSYLFSRRKEKIALALYAIGELKLRKKRQFCLQYLSSRNAILRLHASFALLKLNDKTGISALLELLFSHDKKVIEELSMQVGTVDVRFSPALLRHLRADVADKINKTISHSGAEELKDLGENFLRSLRWFYTLIGEQREIDLINAIMRRI